MEKWGFRFGKMVPKVKPTNLLNTWKIVKGDMVEVTTGKCIGQQGKVLRVQRDTNALIVEGVNLVRRNVPASMSTDGKATVMTMEQPISVSNVALLDPIKKIPTKVKIGWVENTGTGLIKKTRISKESGVEIPRPAPPVRTRTAGPFDTTPQVATEKTFVADLTKSPIPHDCML